MALKHLKPFESFNDKEWPEQQKLQQKFRLPFFSKKEEDAADRLSDLQQTLF